MQPAATALGLDTGPTPLSFIRGRGTTIAMQIYRRLREQIVAGTYPPLHPLSETDLAALFGVSRTPVREAFGKLEEEGLISIQAQYGTFVSLVRVDRVAGDQFVREALECAAVRLACARCCPTEAAALREILVTQHACTTDLAFFAADDALHRGLLVLAGHEAAWHVLDAAKVNLDRIRHLAARSMFKRPLILVEHERIIEAVIARDPDEAAAAMRDHVRGIFASSELMMQRHPEFFQADASHPRPSRRKRPVSGQT